MSAPTVLDAAGSETSRPDPAVTDRVEGSRASARTAARALARATTVTKNAVLTTAADALLARSEEILAPTPATSHARRRRAPPEASWTACG